VATRKIGDYRIIREHGRGGMGAVFQALSPEGATVALKTVLLPERGDPRARWEAIERFQREARAARTLDHPNICQVLDFGADEDTLYIVMEFLDGETVRQLIDLGGAIELRRAVQIVRGVAEAIAHAHDEGVIHRDIKPGNIMILHSGQVKLTDFGVAAIVREAGEPQGGETTGTPLYMSPEQARGEEVDARSDIFSLGATFYEMLTGRRPFQGDDPKMAMNRILTMDPPPIPGLPAPISRILEQCLRKDPKERFQSARDMLAALSAADVEGALDATGGLPIAEPTAAPRRWHPLARLVRGRKRWVALTAAAGLLAVGALAMLRPWARRGDQPIAMFPPGLRPTQPGIVATSLYRGTGRVGGIASSPDGTLLVTMGSADALLPGVYMAQEGDDCDASDAYTQPGEPFDTPSGIWRDPDGRVLVADSGAETVWEVAGPSAPPQVLTNEVPSPCDVLVAPAEFDGPRVDPGDVLVCASSSAGTEAFGLYVVDPHTGDARLLVGLPELQNGLLYAAFGRDGTLYAVEDDDISQNGVTIVKILPDGQVKPFLPNYGNDPQPMAGPIAVHPDTGQVFFAYRSTIYEVPIGGGDPKEYAKQGLDITALEFSPDDSSLFAADAGERVIAKIAPCPIEGKLLVSGWRQAAEGDEPGDEMVCYLLEGRSDNIVQVPLPTGGDLSPFEGELVYVTENEYAADRPWEKVNHIWRAGLGGEGKVNLTEPEQGESINCRPLWSPDGHRIAFLHCDPVAEHRPCETGLQIWVMNADGTAPHLVGKRSEAGEGLGSQSFPEHWWSPSGDQVIYRYGVSAPVWSVHVDGTAPQALEVFSGNLSPDGSKIVCERTKPDTVDGEVGVWRQLCLAKPDGSGLQILVQHFVKDSDIDKHLRLQRKKRTGPRWADDAREWAGPRRVKWSPKGDRVAFLAAFDFDPKGDHYNFQVEVWIYELSTRILTRLTDNAEAEHSLSWRGPNTYPQNPKVTIGNTTVAFSEVSAEGLTTATRDDDPPAEPGGYRLAGDHYHIRTTAQYRGPVEIAITYGDEDVPRGDEESLSLLRYDEPSGEWEDITISRDPRANLVRGEVDFL
jgi:sugar lactone lactonase YvrE